MDYKKDKIYQVLKNVNDEVQIGSTIQPLTKIFHEHKCRANTYRIPKLWNLMREIETYSFYI